MSWTRKEDTQLYKAPIPFACFSYPMWDWEIVKKNSPLAYPIRPFACFSHPMWDWERVKKDSPFAWLFIEAKVTEALLEASIWDFERKVVEASSSFPIVAYL